MNALYATIFATSLVGSLHCLAMCGPLIGMAAGGRSLRFALVHALGRLTTYVALGALAGGLGRALDLAGRLGNVQRIATVLAAAVIVGWGGYTIAVAAGWVRTRSQPASGAAFQRGLVQLRGRRPTTRAWLIGVLTGLLPCGWLWAFVVSAAGTASPLRGGAVMFVFWLGTVPAMTGLLALVGPAIDRLRRRLPILTAAALILLGLGTLATRWTDAGVQGVAQPSCHHTKVAP